jgi:hypothetical protein
MLLDERPLVLLPSLAEAVGVNLAVVIQQLHFHLANPDNGRVHAGEQWIYKTYEDWRALDFPFWSTPQIRRAFRSGEELGLIVSCQPEGRDSRRKYYRIQYDALEKALAHARTWNISKSSDRMHEFVASSSSETTLAKTLPNGSTHQRSRGSRDVSVFFEDGSISEDQREAIRYFNSKLQPLGWLPVTKISKKLSKALEIFEAEDVRQLVDAVCENPEDVSIPKRRTLVRLLWSSY